MNIQSFVRSAALVAALAATSFPVLSKPVNKIINISQNAKLGKQEGEVLYCIDVSLKDTPSTKDSQPK